MIRWYHWAMSIGLNTAIVAIWCLQPQDNPWNGPWIPSDTDEENKPIHLAMSSNSDPQPENTAPVEEPQMDPQQYRATEGNLSGEVDSSTDSSTQSAVDRPKEAAPIERPASAELTNNPPEVNLDDYEVAPESISDRIAPESAEPEPSVEYGNASFTRDDGQAIPRFIINNLNPRLRETLVDRGDLLLVANLGGRAFRFTGSPQAPTAAVIDSYLTGYARRGLVAPAEVRAAAWRVLAREYGYREGQRKNVEIVFLLSHDLDRRINDSQVEAARRFQRPLEELRITYGELHLASGGYRFVVQGVQ